MNRTQPRDHNDPSDAQQIQAPGSKGEQIMTQPQTEPNDNQVPTFRTKAGRCAECNFPVTPWQMACGFCGHMLKSPVPQKRTS